MHAPRGLDACPQAQDQQRNPGKVLEYLGIGKRYGLKRLTACCERHIAGNFLAIVGGGVNAGSGGGAAPELGSDSLMRIVRALAEAVKGYRLQCSASSSSSRCRSNARASQPSACL